MCHTENKKSQGKEAGGDDGSKQGRSVNRSEGDSTEGEGTFFGTIAKMNSTLLLHVNNWTIEYYTFKYCICVCVCVRKRNRECIYTHYTHSS